MELGIPKGLAPANRCFRTGDEKWASRRGGSIVPSSQAGEWGELRRGGLAGPEGWGRVSGRP